MSLKQALLFFAYVFVVAGLLFGCAGRVDLPFFWAWLAVLVGGMVAAAQVMDPELRKERLRPGPGGTDRSLRLVFLPFIVAHIALAGLDVGRFHWSAPVPPTLQTVGLVGCEARRSVSVRPGKSSFRWLVQRALARRRHTDDSGLALDNDVTDVSRSTCDERESYLPLRGVLRLLTNPLGG